MTAGTNVAVAAQYPPEFRWRIWLLCERINEVIAAGRAAGMERVSLRDPRHQWALMDLATDPFVAAVWNCDQVLRRDPWPAMFLNDAEWFCREAGLAVIKHRRIMRLRETPRYKEVRDRICHLTTLEFEICSVMWEGNVRVRDCPFDDKLYARIREEAIEHREELH